MNDPDPQPQPGGPPCVSRRGLLAALGVTGVVVSLAGCQDDEVTPGPVGAAPGTPTAGSAPGPTAGSGAPGPSAAASESPSDAAPSAAPSASAPADVLTTTAAVPVGGGAIVRGVLVVQPTAGRFVAYSARCPHRGAPVTPPVRGVITCPEHNSTFRVSDGARLAGPTPRGLREVPITVRGEDIVRAA